MKILKDNEHVEKRSKQLSLTTAGKEHVEKHGGERKKHVPKTNEEHFEAYKAKIMKQENKIPMKAVDGFYDLLGDGKEHTQEELLEASGYKRTDSTGYKLTVKVMKKFALLEKKGKMTIKRRTD